MILGDHNMELRNYFEHTRGLGVLATSDAEGNVDAALYARPHVMADDTVAFIMTERHSHQNLSSNANAAYLFKEAGNGYEGVRLFLTKVKEERDEARIDSLARKTYDRDIDTGSSARNLVFFRVNKAVPLTSKGRCPVLV